MILACRNNLFGCAAAFAAVFLVGCWWIGVTDVNIDISTFFRGYQRFLRLINVFPGLSTKISVYQQNKPKRYRPCRLLIIARKKRAPWLLQPGTLSFLLFQSVLDRFRYLDRTAGLMLYSWLYAFYHITFLVNRYTCTVWVSSSSE